MPQILISAADLLADINNQDLLIIDVRHDLFDLALGEQVFTQSHISGAQFLHQDNDLSSPLTGTNGRHPLPNAGLLKQKLEKIGLNPNSKVVVYDAGNSSFAVRAWWLLRWLGHSNVAVLNGGFSAWQNINGPVSSGAPISFDDLKPQEYEFTPGMPVKNADDVLATLNDGKHFLIDARDYVRYIGETEPLDAVAGHIPGAVNRPITCNLNADLTFKAPATLRSEYQELIQDQNPELIINYCGSGVTACHNIFAMELAGFSGSSLYSGSWSEWCSDKNRPMQLPKQ